jgi:predicted RND superfamily exporter protein
MHPRLGAHLPLQLSSLQTVGQIIAESILLRLSRLSLVVALLALPFGIFAVVNLPMGSAGVHQWLPEGRLERLRYEAFAKNFGTDQVVLISWEKCAIDDPRLAAFQKRIVGLPDYALWFTKLEATDSVVASLMQPPLRLSEEEAKSRLRGVLCGKDDTSCIVLGVTEEGVRSHKKVIDAVRTVADEVSDLGRDQLRMVGTVFEAYAVDEAAEASLQKLVLPSSVLGFVLSALCLGSVRGALLVLTIASFGQLIAIGLVFYTGNQFSAVLIVLPTLVFMLTLSGAIHLVNYFFEDHAERFPNIRDRGARSIVIGWQPCLLSSATTMLGMGSLVTSQLAPVRQFGIFSAISLGIATAFLLLVFPSVASWIFGSSASRLASSHDDETKIMQSRERNKSWIFFPASFQIAYTNWVGRWSSVIVVVSLLIIGGTSCGLYYLRSSTKFCDMFPESSRTNSDMRWFEAHVGPIATVEVLVHFRDGSRENLLNQVRWIQAIDEALEENQTVGGVFSVATFVPNWPKGSNVRAAVVRSVLKNRIDSGLEEFVSKGLVHESIRKTVMETMQTEPNGTSQKPDDAEFTGLSPVMNDTQIALLQDLGLSFLSAFLLITPVMMWMVNSIRGGLLIMLPNIFPVTFAFGMMGWFALSLDIAGILTASVALGIAVDDTLHFVSWYKRELDAGFSRLEAVKKTYVACGNAMLHTTIISCSAMIPFMFSEFIPTGQFAKLMVVMLVGAIVGDLVMLPALLLSPLGKVIASRSKSVPPINGAT